MLANNWKARNILHIPEPCKHTDAEGARDLMVAYVSDSCSPAERFDFEAHCIVCDECLVMLAIIQDVLRSPSSEEDEKTFACFEAGREAAKIARRPSMTEAQTSDSGRGLRKAA
jgi:hypothetical protein